VQRVDEDENVNARHDQQHVEHDFGYVVLVVDRIEDVPFNFEEAFTVFQVPAAFREGLVEQVNEMNDQEKCCDDEDDPEWLNLARIFLAKWIKLDWRWRPRGKFVYRFNSLNHQPRGVNHDYPEYDDVQPHQGV
jgi:hypothetical protein